MKEIRQLLLVHFIIITAFLQADAPCNADGIRFNEGWWKAEFQGSGAINLEENRDGDYFAAAILEYEFPAWNCCTLGLRAYPLILYSEEKGRDGDEHMIYAGALGVVGCIYQNGDERSGFFGELGFAPMWQSREFRGNSSKVNFLSEAGIGYKFPDSDWHVTLKYSHISNAGLAGKNAGVDAIGFSIGFRF